MMDKSNRYLTPNNKIIELGFWNDVILSGGNKVGNPDSEMIPWCDKFNELNGVCTQQSCSGHVRYANVIFSGHLWLWLDRHNSSNFYMGSFKLSELDCVELVSIMITKWGREVIAIEFKGIDKLDDSMNLILCCMKEILDIPN